MRTRVAAVRVDGSTTIGWGHVRRCLTLAGALEARGFTVVFVCRALDGHPEPLLRGHGFAVHLLPDASEWSWQTDAAATAQALRPYAGAIEWLVVDHYRLDAQWERAVRPAGARIFVIDDLADRPHDADVLLDQNLASSSAQYDGRVGDACVRLIGVEWALLGPAYAAAHDRMPPRSGRVQRVLVSFGGADQANITDRVVRALLDAARDDLAIDVVVSGASPHTPALQALAAASPSITVWTDAPDLVSLLARADFAIGAGGVTSWERLAMGVPSIVLTLAPNQQPNARALDRAGVARWLGDAAEITDAALATALRAAVLSDLDEAQSQTCLSMVDGRGATRVAAVMTMEAGMSVHARAVGPGDEARVLAWANDRETRRQAFSPEPITADTHRRWFRRQLRNIDGCEFFIIETRDGVGVGQVRLERSTAAGENVAWEVHYLVAPPFRRRGLGRVILDAGLRAFAARRGPAAVTGRVKRDNVASSRVFEALGFDAATDAAGDVLVFTRTWGRN